MESISAETSPPVVASPPKKFLYTAPAVMLATFLGSPAAGTLLMAFNYSRLGRPRAARIAFIIGALADVFLFTALHELPQGAWLILTIVNTIIMFYLARMLQGPAVEDHQMNGGDIAPASKALGVGMLGFGIIFAGVLALYIQDFPVWGTPITFETNKLYYSGDSTLADANALVLAFRKEHYFGRRSDRTILLSKNKKGTLIRYQMNPDLKDDQETIRFFVSLTNKVAPSVGGIPITIKFVDKDLTILRTELVK